ncbi:hypothetical protein [Fulvivirga ligni]|uniref:hypothetical protein n=1 Tax=Fulvivirga ligni TaxID=2904246 RepID=UPI001F41B9D2|nr:hypothetical protein [Fulvivirga ligni]UII21497.1 hypothetical protein LVD16_27085 [Fulvivirga ligni]
MKKLIYVVVMLSLFIVYNAQAQTGNVGIGTTTPTEKLEVNGNIKDAAFSTTWTSGATYSANYVVLYNGSLYKHLTTTNTAVTPDEDATNWRTVSTLVTSPVETLTITATGTAPNKATTTINDYIYATDDGGWVTVNFEYSHTNITGATAGSGSYIFKLPEGYSFDTSVHPVNTQASNVSGTTEVHKLIHLSGLL